MRRQGARHAHDRGGADELPWRARSWRTSRFCGRLVLRIVRSPGRRAGRIARDPPRCLCSSGIAALAGRREALGRRAGCGQSALVAQPMQASAASTRGTSARSTRDLRPRHDSRPRGPQAPGRHPSAPPRGAADDEVTTLDRLPITTAGAHAARPRGPPDSAGQSARSGARPRRAATARGLRRSCTRFSRATRRRPGSPALHATLSRYVVWQRRDAAVCWRSLCFELCDATVCRGRRSTAALKERLRDFHLAWSPRLVVRGGSVYVAPVPVGAERRPRARRRACAGGLSHAAIHVGAGHAPARLRFRGVGGGTRAP